MHAYMSNSLQIVSAKSKVLVRLALFRQKSGLPLSRVEINKKGTHFVEFGCSCAAVYRWLVMGRHSLLFAEVFRGAQTHLRSVFGMELVELASCVDEEDEGVGSLPGTGLKRKGTLGRCGFRVCGLRSANRSSRRCEVVCS